MHWTKSVATTAVLCAIGVSIGAPATIFGCPIHDEVMGGKPQTSASPSPSQAAQAQPTGPEWWRHAVIYEIYPRSFQDSDGDGIGDIKGITARLDYLRDLGIDAIWITPMYPSPGIDYGYDISDYTAIDPEYGTMADFDNLVAEAKKRDIRVIMDLRHQPHLRPEQVVS